MTSSVVRSERLGSRAVSTYAYTMESAAQLVRRARVDGGLSVRSLADRARVAASTVARIESGRVDPTYAMLCRIIDATGMALQVSLGARARLADLATAWRREAWGDVPDWTRVRAFLDLLALHPEWVVSASAARPMASGSLMMDALLAGMAEKLADDAGQARPDWVVTVPGLDVEWAAPGTPQMLAARRRTTPPQLSARGLVLDTGSLWRAPVPLHA